MTMISELTIAEMDLVAGGCPHGLVDGSSYANVGCITPAQLAGLIEGLENRDSNPPMAGPITTPANEGIMGNNVNGFNDGTVGPFPFS